MQTAMPTAGNAKDDRLLKLMPQWANPTAGSLYEIRLKMTSKLQDVKSKYST